MRKNKVINYETKNYRFYLTVNAYMLFALWYGF